ncbi:MAG: hypothetical protein IPO09_17090 [Anaeromyxobacter sp.]|nr:hypothetical protein [Anaeromyxobacter sp.]MBL0276580.1 hypothetical protein [Anaeromyxobacter sp.]
MKAVRLGELQELIQGPVFSAWWTDYARAVSAWEGLSARRQELLSQAELMELRSELAQRTAMDAFSDGGSAEEAAARLGTEAQVLENRALALVGHFEEQRNRTSEAWYRLGGVERALEETSDAAARKPLERQLPALQQEYGVEVQRRDRVWAEVEETWARSLERSLLSSEHAARARRIRKDAERLFKEAEERRQRAQQLRADADAAARDEAGAGQRCAQLLDRASRELGCVHGDRFLYWRRLDDKRAAFAVPLASDAEGHNLPLAPLAIHAVGPLRGVAYLEPAHEGPETSAEEGERRFQEFLLGPRGDGGRPPGHGDGPGQA